MTAPNSSIPEKTEYRTIPGFSLYRAGTDGSIWSTIYRGMRGSAPRGARRHWCKLVPFAQKLNGHMKVAIRPDTGRPRKVYVHRLILEAFVGPCPDGMECCHDPDPNPANNCLENIRWDTPLENKQDSRRQGTLPVGSKASCAKLKEADIPQIRAMLAGGVKQKDIAIRFGVSRPMISNIANGKNWTHA